MRKLVLTLSAGLLFFFSLQAQKSISGTIIDGSANAPLPGATIVEKGTSNGTITNIEGFFTLNVSNEKSILVVSFMGFLSEEVTIPETGKIEVVLVPDLQAIEEVVIVGYGTQKKSVITGSIAKVDREMIEKSRSTRIEQALQGQTAGVVIMNNSGQPGDNLTIRIRGVGTVKDADPYFIVDGLPLEKEGLDFLNPEDIESVEVLKDASSTAIYGTRGANGVVLITTKSGKTKEKINVSYSGYYGIQNPWRKVDMLGTEQYIELLNEGRANDKRSPIFTQERIDTLRWNTDWQDEMFYKNAPKKSHTVTLTGGNEKSSFSSSISYLNQDGIVAKGKSNFERITFRTNSSYNVTKRLVLSANFNLANIKRKGISTNDQFSPYSLIQGANTPPIIPVKFDNGSWATPESFGLGLQEITNPIAMLSYLNQKQTINKFIGGLEAEYKIIEGLSFKTHFTSEISYVTDDQYIPKYHLDATHESLQNSVTKEITQYNRWNFDNILQYSKSIANHNFTLLAGITYFKNWSTDLGASKSNLIFDDPDKAYLDNGTVTNGIPYGGYVENRLASSYGRLNYNYSEKYLFEALVRRDGSTRFGTNKRFGIFPAVSAGWVISKEDFFPQQEILNFAKLRGSWGQNGNDQIPDFQYSSIMVNQDIYFFGQNKDMYYGIRPARVPNPEVSWEKSEQLTFGADLRFLQNKLSLTADYYDKRTKDWLLHAPAGMLIIGNDLSDENAGEVSNKGFEFELNYKSSVNEFSYSVALTGATNKSKVISLNNDNGYIEGGSSFAQSGSIIRAEPGSPLGYFYGYKILGVFQTSEEVQAYVNSEGKMLQPFAKPGDFKWADVNGDGSITNDNKDKTNIGSPYPKFTCGMNLSLEWKGIDLYMFWYTALGHDIYMATRRYDVGEVNYSQEDYDNRWTGPGSTNDSPRFSFLDPNKNYERPSKYFVYKANYLRLKNISLGYTLPDKFTKAVNIQKVRFYVSSENLLTLTKYPGFEVEVGGEPLSLGIDKGVYPQAKTFVFGVNLNF